MRQDREQVGGGKQEGKLHWQRAGKLEMQLQVQENGTLQGTEPREVATLSSAHRQNMFLLPPHRVLALVDPTPLCLRHVDVSFRFCSCSDSSCLPKVSCSCLIDIEARRDDTSGEDRSRTL